MINIKGVFNKLLKDVEESSPNLKSALSEIAPICICISIKGHQKIYLVIDNDSSDITFQHRNHDFEIKGTLIELLRVLASGNINKNLIYGDSELAIVFFNAIYKSNIDLIYLIDKYFGNLPAVFTYAIVNKIFKSSEVYDDKKQRKIRRRLRDIAIRIDRIEALRGS